MKAEVSRPRLLRDADNDPVVTARWCAGWLGWLSRPLLAVTRVVCWVCPVVARPVDRLAVLVAAGVPVVSTVGQAEQVVGRLPRSAAGDLAGQVARDRIVVALYDELAVRVWAQALAVSQRLRLARQELAHATAMAAIHAHRDTGRNTDRDTGRDGDQDTGRDADQDTGRDADCAGGGVR